MERLPGNIKIVYLPSLSLSLSPPPCDSEEESPRQFASLSLTL